MAHSSSDGHVGYILWPRIAASRKNHGMFSQCLVCPEGLSLDGFTCEKAKVLLISLAKIPTLHRIAVGRNLESWWRYEGGLIL